MRLPTLAALLLLPAVPALSQGLTVVQCLAEVEDETGLTACIGQMADDCIAAGAAEPTLCRDREAAAWGQIIDREVARIDGLGDPAFARAQGLWSGWRDGECAWAQGQGGLAAKVDCLLALNADRAITLMAAPVWQ